MSALLLALLSSLGYGASDFVAGQAARRLPASLLVLVSQSVQGGLALGLALLSAQPLSADALLWSGAAGMLNGLGLVAYYHALARGPAGVVAPLIAEFAAPPWFTAKS